MKRTISRKEIYQTEIKTGTNIEDNEIYTNRMQLVRTALKEREYVCINNQWIFSTDDVLSKSEQEELINEISQLKKKIRTYKKMASKL